MKGIRLDILMVEKGIVQSQAKAQALVMAGKVLVNGETVTTSGKLLDHQSEIHLSEDLPYVSRGGVKLEHALARFGINPEGQVMLDTGAGTGGFTDCLLKRGASKVYAVDVGYGQLDYQLRRDDRVIVMERVNARYFFKLPEKVDLITIDVSFISATKVIASVIEHLKPEGKIILLFKPQFEALKNEVGKNGIIDDAVLRARIIGRFVKWAIQNRILIDDMTASPIKGNEGNQEFLLLLKQEKNTYEV